MIKPLVKPLVLATTAVLASTSAVANSSPWTLRLGVSHIQTESEASRTTAGDVRELSASGLSLNVNYAFTPNWVLDVLGALPFEHDIEVNGQRIAETKHLPPTVTMKYHFMPGQPVDYYLGAGLNYTVFFDEQIDGGELELSDSFGLTAMAGVDFNWGTPWSIGADIRYIQIETEASVNGAVIGDVEINPWVFSTNVAYRF